MQVAEILVGLASSNIDRLFTYLVPNSLKERIKLGVRVRILLVTKLQKVLF